MESYSLRSVSHVTLLKWLLVIVIISILIASASAIFLTALHWVTDYREANLWIIWLLPLAGLAIGLAYHYWGGNVVKGNNLLLEEYHKPKKVIPFIMIPLVFFGTLATHLFGGSAGREGTAVQMGGAIADRSLKILRSTNNDRQIIIIIGISAGFASVFGTPLAGAIFALEVMTLKKIKYRAILQSILAAFIADYTCRQYGIIHIQYTIPLVPDITIINLFWTILAGLLFGITAWLFTKSGNIFSRIFRYIKYPPLRPFAGGILIVAAVWAMGTTRYIGLGIPTIVEAFHTQVPSYDFIIKLFLTALTLSAGFKGGEVTPLFFIGATLGSALSIYLPLPIALLAGMGFVAVFSGATNTPLACTAMGMELFGADCGLYVAFACFAAYLVAGSKGIYSSQQPGTKHLLYKKLRRNILTIL